MKGKEHRGAPPADLLVCFPSRAHLTLMPKPICSPARPSEPKSRHRRRHSHHFLNKSSTARGGASSSSSSGRQGLGGSPLFGSRSKQMSGSNGHELSEPTSPKVTCAGQIKVRNRSSGCRNWQSVMEEIERMHSTRKQRKKPSWAESLGFKKEIMQFLTCLRTIRFDFRCFGAYPTAEISSDEEEEDEEDENETYHRDHPHLGTEENEDPSRTVFSKWFMVLDENQSNAESKKLEVKDGGYCNSDEELEDESSLPPPPPPNALLLMRSRSAPPKGWLQEEKESNFEEEEQKAEKVEEEKNVKKRESLAIVMRYDTDFYRLSTDIAREAWVVGGLKDPLSRSRSWKR